MEKKGHSVLDLFDQADLEQDTNMTGMRVFDDPAHQHVREDVKQLSRDALEKLVVGLVDADRVNAARVHKVLEAAKADGDRARKEEAAMLAEGHQSSWQTINKGKVVIEHLRQERAADDVFTFEGHLREEGAMEEVFTFSGGSSTGAKTVEGPPLAPGEAVCKYCRCRYFRKDNTDDQACVRHEGEPIFHPASGPGEMLSQQYWIWPCCRQKELDVMEWENPCSVGRHAPLIARPGPPGVVYDDSESESKSELEDAPAGDKPASDESDAEAQLASDTEDESMHSVRDELSQLNLDSEMS
ncbi:hypothetical protein PG984_007776 [Apiospora sp. TS-2023a]